MEQEAKIRHLEMIQNVIDRMGRNLFFLKGWSITLIGGLFVLGAKDSDLTLMVLAYVPLFMFWVLDAYFLSHERRFRSLYKAVSKRNPKEIDFSMNADQYKEEKNNKIIDAFASGTLVGFYLPLILVMLFVIIKIQYFP